METQTGRKNKCLDCGVNLNDFDYKVNKCWNCGKAINKYKSVFIVLSNSIKEIEKENEEFMQNQADENINDLLVNKPRAKQIKKNMSEFVKGLK